MASRVPRLGDHQKKNNSLFYLKKAKQACVKNDYAEAYESFVLYFESLNDPSDSTSAVQTVFTKLVCKMGAILEETSNIEELLKCYIQALNFFPDNYVILSNLGAYMFKISEIDIARRYLERAVKVNKNYLPAEINLMHVKWHQVPRWHFRMLNDKARNLAYKSAIRSIIKDGYTNVVDIGAGCGLLSLIAAEMPGTSIVAIEENKQLYNMCLDVMKKNEVTNVKVLHCYSTDIEEPPDKCNLLVTEVFDCALFGERALETIYHASTVLRTEEDYKIVPCGAKVYVTGITCHDLIRRHKWVLCKSQHLLNLHNVCLTQYDLEPYEAEPLVEREIKYMTDIRQVFDIDFYDLEQIRILSHDSYKKIVKLRCIEEGEIHAFTVWFDLNLNENISLTNNPLDENQVMCWEQAVIYLDHPIHVVEGTIITIEVTIKDCGLHVTLVETDRGNHTCFKVSKEVVTFLNDHKLVDCIAALAQKFWNTSLTIVDNNSCPLLGFLLAKNNGSTVYHPITSETDKEFFEYVLSVNHIPKERFKIVNELEVSADQGTFVFFLDTVNVDGSLENCCFKKNEIGSSINIPQSLSIVVQLISSPFVEFCNLVDDDNVMKFKIADIINEYSGYEHPNLERLMYTEHSLPVKFHLEGDGEKSKEIVVKRSGVANALLLWYDIQFYDDIVYSTLNSIHFKKSCFFFHEPKEVELGDCVTINMQTNGTYMKFYI